MRYDFLERLGSGAHGEGYLARRLADGQRVFVKVLKSSLSEDDEWAARFADEVALLRSCVHPNIVRYIETFRDQTGSLCLVTEYLDGEDLKARLRKSGALPPRHALALALPLCNALEYLHGRDVVHRDLTPENILVSGRFPDVVPRLLDFGLAWSAGPRKAQTGAALALAPLYAAPESLEGRRATAASDIYALGAILYEALSGAPPFSAGTVDGILERQRLGVLAPLPRGASALLPVLRRCLAYAPEARWGSVGELARALQSAASSDDDGVPTRVAPDAKAPSRAPSVVPAPIPARERSLGSVGNYDLVRELGKGGMGKVYLARHSKLGRQVAIKVLRAEAMADRDAVLRFFNEARTVNAINHEHIVEIFDFVEEEGPNPKIYCVMELLVGDSLLALRKAAPLPIARLLHICRQVADALAAAHRAGVVHRDVKPANIFVTARSGVQDYVKVLDFGVAKVNAQLPGDTHTPSVNTQTGLSLGTPDYMSPEQVTAAPVDGRTDVFALGVMLYELLAGYRPFVGSNVAHLVVKVVREPHTPLPAISASGEKIPPALARLVNRCLEKKRENRPQSMEEVSATLERILQALPSASAVSALQDVAAPPRSAPLRRWIAPSLIVLALIAGGVFGATRFGERKSAPPGARMVAPLEGTAAAPQPRPEPVAPDAPAPAPVAPAPAPVAPRPAPTVELGIDTTPTGATVVRMDSGERLGVTPLRARFPHGTVPVALRLELAGHAPLEHSLVPDAPREVRLALKAQPALAPERPAPVRRTPPRKTKAEPKEDPDAVLDPFAD